MRKAPKRRVFGTCKLSRSIEGIIILCLLLGALTACAESADPDLVDVESSGVSGVYTDLPDSSRRVEGEFSWGVSSYVPNGSVIVDLGATPPYLSLPGLTIPVLAWSKLDETTDELVLDMPPPAPAEVKAVFKISGDILEIESEYLWSSNPDRPLIRIGGP